MKTILKLTVIYTVAYAAAYFVTMVILTTLFRLAAKSK